VIGIVRRLAGDLNTAGIVSEMESVIEAMWQMISAQAAGSRLSTGESKREKEKQKSLLRDRRACALHPRCKIRGGGEKKRSKTEKGKELARTTHEERLDA